jgi:hypothetical protein
MSTQYHLNFSQRIPPKEQERILAAMQACEDHANDEFAMNLRRAAYEAAYRHPLLTADEVWEQFSVIQAERVLGGLPRLENHKVNDVIGSIMRSLAKANDPPIAKTSETRRSKRPGSHGNLIVVWCSLRYQGRKA